MPKLIIVIGLPGSGKTTYLESIKASGEIEKFFDSYQGDAYDTSGNPYLSKNYGPLIVALKTSKLPIAVCDIIFCVEKDLHNFLHAVFTVIPEVEVEYRYFENNPEACTRNIQTRARPGRVEKEIEFVRTHSPDYIIPSVQVLEVYRSE